MSPNNSPGTPVAPGDGAGLEAWLGYLESIHPSEIDLGLDRVLIVLRRLFPRSLPGRVIIVGGTNGKGSTIACLEALLRSAGRSVGAYTSPHIERYNERVRINGEDVSDDSLVAAFRSVEQARGRVSLTYFEFGTLAAFLLLAEAGVEDWLLEVGLGGRLDAVNVLDPELAIITSVDIDHVGFLGDNREVIGFEKAGILRPGITAICADDNPPDSILQQAAAQQVRLLRPGDGYELEATGDGTVLRNQGHSALLLPDSPLPAASLATAIIAARLLVPSLSALDAAEALARVAVPGRMEHFPGPPDVYLDVGHNPHAARWLAGRLSSMRRHGGRILGVYGALADKDVEGVVTGLAPVLDYWYLANLEVPRGLSGEQLRQRAGEQLEAGAVETPGSVSDALSAAFRAAREEDLIIVFGSFFTVAQARPLLITQTGHSSFLQITP